MSGLLPPAVVRYVLTGEPGAVLDQLIFDAVQAGIGLERVAAGRYRIEADDDARGRLGMHAAMQGPYLVEVETTPPTACVLTERMTRTHPFPRTAEVSTGITAVVARAVDRGLEIEPVGVGRFRVTGRSSVQFDWLADALGRTRDDVIVDLFKLNAAQIDAEDRAGPVPPIVVHAVMPPRVTETVVTHDDAGNLIGSKTTERTAE